MGKINGCLKCVFIFFNVIFAILGCLMIYGAVMGTADNHELSVVWSSSSYWAWIVAIAVLGISCLGIYAACSEKALALKIFAGFMGAGMVIMMILGILALVLRNQITDNLHSISQEPDFEKMLDELQGTEHCCGLLSASDWGEDIPDSCECRTYRRQDFSGYRCIDRPHGTTGPDQIYEATCKNVIQFYVGLVFQIAMGFFFGCAVIALLCLLVSLLMNHQVKRHDNPGATSIAMNAY